MGRIAAPHGVKGWVKVASFTSTPDALARYPRWWIGARGEWEEVEVAETAMHDTVLAARLAGCTDRDAAGRLRGREVAVPREALPEPAPGEYYWADLIGYDVLTVKGEPLGKVTGLFSTGPHDVMRVGEGNEERLLPFVETVVRRVDVAARRIEVDWGLDW
jgi:16S rRNA processing protein RimM